MFIAMMLRTIDALVVSSLYIENSDVIYTNSNTRDAAAENAKIWAATELAITTNSPAYLTTDDVIWEAISFHDAVETEYDEADASANSVEELGAFGADNTYALSALSLILHPDILGEYSNAPSKNLVAAADDILKAQSSNSFGMPVEAHKYSQTLHNGKVKADIICFNYGSNADVVSNAIILAYASADSKKDKYMNGVYQAAEFLMGRNPIAYFYLSMASSICLSILRHNTFDDFVGMIIAVFCLYQGIYLKKA